MFKDLSKKAKESFIIPAYMVLILWVIHTLQFVTGISLGQLGVFPRELWGLKGVIFSPLIHGDWGHLISNTPPLFVLSAMILFFYRRIAVPAFIMIYLLTGMAVWAFADLFEMARHFHIGASGVIYGLVAFVFWNGVFRRNIRSIALALIMVFYYGSMVYGVLPGQEGISWESHLLGALVGIFTSFWYKDVIEKDEERQPYSWETEDESEEKFFLDRDTFERTKMEREQERNDQFPNWFSNRT